jgi:hypothetical protein
MPTKRKPKSRKMDKKLVASKQKWEVSYIIKKFKSISKEKLLSFVKQAGRSRVKLYQLIANELERRNNSRIEG